jgi:hypothetical protein
MKKTTTLQQLPDRNALKSLDKTQRTIADYAKLTPIRSLAPNPLVMQNLRKP